MRNNRTIRVVFSRTPLLVGLLLIYAGLYKAVYPGEATLALMALGAPSGLAGILIDVVTCAELYLGILLMTGVDRQAALWGATALMLLFSLFLFYLSVMAHPPACGCLGLTGAFSSNRHSALFGLARNCFLLWLLRGAYDH